MISTLLFICAISPAPQAPAMPHPSLPVREQDDYLYFNEEFAGYGRWILLEPSWIERGTDFEGEGRVSLLNRVASSRGLEDSVVQSWVTASNPEPLVIHYRILANGTEVLAGRESVAFGRAVVLSDISYISEILDFDVEIASGSGILDPIIGRQYSGTSLALEALPLPGMGWQMEIALVHSTTAPSELLEDGYAQMDGKMRLIEHTAECGLTAAVVPGKTFHLELADLGPGKVVLELQVEGQVPPLTTQLEDDLVLITVPTLARMRNWSKFLDSFEEQALVWSNAQGVLVFEGEDALAMATSAAAQASASLQPIQFDVSVQTILDGVEEKPSSLRLTGLENTTLTFAQGTVRDALIDWDVEVALVSRIADPVFQNFFSGAQGKLVGRLRPDGRLEVDLDFTFSVVDMHEPRRIRLAAATLGEVGYEGDIPARPAQDLAIETPEVGQLRFQGTYVADADGRIMLVRSARSLFGDGARLRLILQVATPK